MRRWIIAVLTSGSLLAFTSCFSSGTGTVSGGGSITGTGSGGTVVSGTGVSAGGNGAVGGGASY